MIMNMNSKIEKEQTGIEVYYFFLYFFSFYDYIDSNIVSNVLCTLAY